MLAIDGFSSQPCSESQRALPPGGQMRIEARIGVRNGEGEERVRGREAAWQQLERARNHPPTPKGPSQLKNPWKKGRGISHRCAHGPTSGS